MFVMFWGLIDLFNGWHRSSSKGDFQKNHSLGSAGRGKGRLKERAFIIDDDGEIEYPLEEAIALSKECGYVYKGPFRIGDYVRHEFHLR